MALSMVYLGLGSNLGNKEENLINAIKSIDSLIGKVSVKSEFYASKPWGFNSENDFINCVIAVETNLSPFEILDLTQQIELSLGRIKKPQAREYFDRKIDIDILLYDDLIINTPTLTIPHPHLVHRNFVFRPLCEIAPNYFHPVLQKRIIDLV